MIGVLSVNWQKKYWPDAKIPFDPFKDHSYDAKRLNDAGLPNIIEEPLTHGEKVWPARKRVANDLWRAGLDAFGLMINKDFVYNNYQNGKFALENQWFYKVFAYIFL